MRRDVLAACVVVCGQRFAPRLGAVLELFPGAPGQQTCQPRTVLSYRRMVDLHTHTTYSDGTCSPRRLVELAAQIGLSAVAITDHDSIGGVAEAAAAGSELGVEVVAGVEINLFHDGLTVDLLGYFPSGPPDAARLDSDPPGAARSGAEPPDAEPPAGGELRTALLELRRARDERNAQILERLAKLGYPVAPDELAAIAGSGAVGRPHIGEAMRRRGYVDSITEAFERFLARGAPAWVDRRRLTLSEAVRLVARADGLAVIAHPGIIRTDAAGLARLVGEARRCGVDGLECFYPEHDEQMVAHCLVLAATNGLVPTGGSDFHGETKPDVRLGQANGGRPVPDAVLAGLKARWAERQAARVSGTPQPEC
jgi:predicted metal-dependent phosphoesterase TrpH